MNWKILTVTVFVTGCGHQGFSRGPAPQVFLHCFTLTAGDSSTAYIGQTPQLPRAINLGTTAKRRAGRTPLQVGTLIPETGDLRALWRLRPPDSLIIDLVPASTGMALMSGTTLYTRVNDTLITGKAVFWSDEIDTEHTVPIVGRRVSCPAGD